MKNFEMGLVSVSFRQHTPEEIVKATKKAGLKFIEWGSDVHAPYNEIERLQEIKKLQDEYDIKCSSYGTYFKLGVTDISELEGYIAAAKVLGTDVLRLWCGNHGSAEYSEKEKAELFEQSKLAADIAKKHNVTLCMECHINTYTDDKNSALELMETIDSPHFKMYWQPNQFKTIEENISYLKLLIPYIEHIHVFNWKGRDRFPLAEGINEWKEYLSFLKKSHILLLEFMPDDRIESLEAETDSLSKIMEEVL